MGLSPSPEPEVCASCRTSLLSNPGWRCLRGRSTSECQRLLTLTTPLNSGREERAHRSLQALRQLTGACGRAYFACVLLAVSEPLLCWLGCASRVSLLICVNSSKHFLKHAAMHAKHSPSSLPSIDRQKHTP